MAQAKTLADVYARIRTCQADGTQRAVTICFLGDSNTRGMAIDPDRARHRHAARVLAELADRYAPCSFTGIASGIPGDTMTGALTRIEDDVLRYTPDLSIIAFALNDAVQGGIEGVITFGARIHQRYLLSHSASDNASLGLPLYLTEPTNFTATVGSHVQFITAANDR